MLDAIIPLDEFYHYGCTISRSVISTLSQKKTGEPMPWPNDAQYFNAVQAIKEKYLFRGDQLEVSQFLEKYPFLVPVLAEAHRNIMKYFPNNPPVFLEVSSDTEEFGADQLVASIATNLDPDTAANALSAFDRNWWLNSLKWTQGKLCVTLEFL